MKKATKTDRSRSGHSDLVGIDFSTTATKVVRLKKSKGELVLAGVDLQPTDPDAAGLNPFIMIGTTDEVVTHHNGMYNRVFIDFLVERFGPHPEWDEFAY